MPYIHQKYSRASERSARNDPPPLLGNQQQQQQQQPLWAIYTHRAESFLFGQPEAVCCPTPPPRLHRREVYLAHGDRNMAPQHLSPTNQPTKPTVLPGAVPGPVDGTARTLFTGAMYVRDFVQEYNTMHKHPCDESSYYPLCSPLLLGRQVFPPLTRPPKTTKNAERLCVRSSVLCGLLRVWGGDQQTWENHKNKKTHVRIAPEEE